MFDCINVAGIEFFCTCVSGTCLPVTTSASNVPTADLVNLAPDSDVPQLQPPPLPPRRRNTNNRDSTSSSASSDVFLIGSSPEPPILPPRTDPDLPPPVPPRRDSMYNSSSLNRGHSFSQPRTPTLLPNTTRSVPPLQSRTNSASQFPTVALQNPVQSATLPRYHGGRDSRCDNTDNIFNFNGDSDIPELPPKTYRSHARKQSS